MEFHPRIDRLVWDDWNRDHLTKHAVVPKEAEEVDSGDPVISAGYKGRLIFTGSTAAG